MKLLSSFSLVWLALLAAGCNSEPERAPAIGEAFVGPTTLSLRQDISLRSSPVATVKHGERLEIIQKRRRFVKVRTGRRVEGWTDERMLLTPQQVESLRLLASQSKSVPSQGVASTYEMLNVHTEPNRQSPSFFQIKEAEKVDVIARKVAPRASPPPPPAPRAAAPQKKTKSGKAAREKHEDVPPPPPPPGPALPKDWLELSALGRAVLPPKPEPPPEPMDDWSLVRNASGQTGWVLTRRLYMAIPDEVAQYAEGRRITSYFPAGEVHDGDEVKHYWVWTTVEHGLTPYDFDSFRVFIWSLNHHRYETSHIERNLKGYYPVLQHPVVLPGNPKGKGPAGDTEKLPGFSILVEKKDGARYRRSYAFTGNTVRFVGEEKVEAPAPYAPRSDLIASTQAPESAHATDSFYGRMWERVDGWRKRWFGK